MTVPVWVSVCADADLSAGKLRLVLPRGLPVLLIRISAQELYAVSNLCPHMACPLHRGRLDGYVLTCPCHDWQFDVRSGGMIDTPEIKIATYPAKADNGMISVQIQEER